MVVMTAKLSKGKLITILLIIVVIVGLLAALCSSVKDGGNTENAAPAVSTNEDRVAYLQSMGWDVNQDPVESQEVRVPEQLPEVLARYNELQKSQGYDLTNYGGKTLKRYVYEILNYPDTTDRFFATLLLYQDHLVGGDVSSSAQGGIMQGLEFPKQS